VQLVFWMVEQQNRRGNINFYFCSGDFHLLLLLLLIPTVFFSLIDVVFFVIVLRCFGLSAVVVESSIVFGFSSEFHPSMFCLFDCSSSLSRISGESTAGFDFGIEGKSPTHKQQAFNSIEKLRNHNNEAERE